MFRVRRTAPLSRVEYAMRERKKNNRKNKKKKKKIITNGVFSQAIKRSKKLYFFFSLNFTAVDNLCVAKFDYEVKV